MARGEHEGTYGRYVNGCRCEGCTSANASYHRRRRRNRINLPLDPLRPFLDAVPDDDLREWFGVTPGALARWEKSGIPLVDGDRIACRLGYHPLTIWGDLYWTATL